MLTERQSAVFRIIRQHVAEYGFAPTLEELCEATGTKSVGSMSKHVAALASAGLIERTNGARQISLKHACPYCGQKIKHRGGTADG